MQWKTIDRENCKGSLLTRRNTNSRQQDKFFANFRNARKPQSHTDQGRRRNRRSQRETKEAGRKIRKGAQRQLNIGTPIEGEGWPSQKNGANSRTQEGTRFKEKYECYDVAVVNVDTILYAKFPAFKNAPSHITTKLRLADPVTVADMTYSSLSVQWPIFFFFFFYPLRCPVFICPPDTRFTQK